MSNCIKELYDYDLVKNCSKCGIVSLKSNFHKNKTKRDGLQSRCKLCVNEYYLKNNDKIILKTRDWNKSNPEKVKQNQKKYNEQNKEKRIIYLRNKRETDVNYRMIVYTRNRIYKSLKGTTKQSSTKEILGIDIDLYRKWLEFQFTSEMNWSNIEVDHIKPICMFDVSDDDQLKEAFSWKNTQPLLKKDHQLKRTKFNFLDYQLQFIKAYQFIKLNEERFNENIH